MKKSITRRLFGEIVLVVLSFSALILLANTLLLGPFYNRSIRKTMLIAMEELSRIDYSGDSADWEGQIEAVASGNAYDVTLVRNYEILYSSSAEIGLQPALRNNNVNNDDNGSDNSQRFPEDKRPVHSFELFSPDRLEQRTVLGDGAIVIGTTVEPRTQSEMVVCIGTLDESTLLYLTQPVEPIQQSVTQSNILLAGCTLLFLGVSALLAFRISKRFTEPIRSIKSQVGEITRLDFGGKCAVHTGDELESLSQDVNQLSDTLESALARLQRQYVQLERDMLSQRKFISNASHELRTPLSLIKGYADEMNAGFVGDPEQRKLYTAIISEESAKMNRLLKEILDLFRLESGRMEFRPERLSVRESVTAFLDKYHGFLTDNNLSVILDFGAADDGYFDAMRFEQVLANYISNAAKYGAGDHRVRIDTRDAGDSIRVGVYNTGRPISEDVLPLIWDGFYKADDARTHSEEGGYGLGLSIVKAIQTVAGQDFGVVNHEDGVTFWFDVRKYGNEAAPDGTQE